METHPFKHKLLCNVSVETTNEWRESLRSKQHYQEGSEEIPWLLTADRHDYGFQIRHLLQKLQCNGPLATDGRPIVEWRDHDGAGTLLYAPRSLFPRWQSRLTEDNVSAIPSNSGHFAFWSSVGDDDMCRDVAEAGGQGARSGMIAAASHENDDKF